MSDVASLAARPSVEPAPTATRRRLIVLALNLALLAALAAGVAAVLAPGGWTVAEVLFLAAFLVAAPWTVLGFWNAVIGLWLLHGRRDGLAAVAPFARAAEAGERLRLTTAVLMTLRNEDPARALARLEIVERSIAATGEGEHFRYFILSDTSSPEIAAGEEAAFAAWRARSEHPDRIVYRRRADNAGFKAGNLRDFLDRWGGAHDLMLPLDADSLMDGATVVGLVRMMQASPGLGILQSLVVGAPAASAFARIFQFGMRAGMRSYTTGAAWWTADCGPFWGHNALVRIAPFRAHCDLPVLPGRPPLGGPILSHDQVEAVLMRRAGYAVRVLPVEGGSFEENPPTLLDFMARDQRWCQGNLQYPRLLALPGLLPTSRFQLAWAILMFLGVPAATLMTALVPLLVLDAAGTPVGLALALYLGFLGLNLVPKLAGYLDIGLTPGGARAYGGLGRVLAGAALETVFSYLLEPVSRLRTTLFMAGLALGRSITWGGQERDARGLRWGAAFAMLWPSPVFGLAVLGATAVSSPAAALWALPVTLGHLVAVPFAVATASPTLGRWLAGHRLCAIPEELAPPPEIAALRGAGR